ncbi:MAG: hypothetical protein CL917_09270 [Deltaproteobacteria bacterium]|nr:hypothetical protein [Deltaproteobacteria bacterium]
MLTSIDLLKTSKTHRVFRLPLLSLILRLSAVLILSGCGETAARFNQGQPDAKAWVSIGHSRIPVELALTPEEQRLGLGERDTLSWGHGLLFVFDQPNFRRFWMKGMRFDIDIIWIRDGRISSIARDVRHVLGENGPTVMSSELVDQVLEVPAGFSQSQGWRKGQKVRIEWAQGSP